MLVKGIDISNWSGTIPAEMFATVKHNRQLDFLICGTQSPSITRQQIQQAIAGGFDGNHQNLYVFLYNDEGIRSRILEAIAIAKEFGIPRIWLDVEAADGDPRGLQHCSSDEIVSILDRSIVPIQDAGLEVGIYTSGGFWQAHLGDTTLYKDLPLWNASWVLSRDITEDDFSHWAEKWPEYGGWKQPAIWQYQGSTNLDGINADLNVAYFMDASDASEDGSGSNTDVPVEEPVEESPIEVSVSRQLIIDVCEQLRLTANMLESLL